ncbi:unnamed protein product, partial [Rotaria sp. Silwood2]
MQYPFSSSIKHFVSPKQWSSMHIAKELEIKTGKAIIHFEKGDYSGSEFNPPSHIVDAVTNAIKDGYIRYDPGAGLNELRQAIATEMTKCGRQTILDEVLVTAGAKHALQMSLLSFLEQGDEIIFPNPGYPPDEVWARFAGVTIKHVPLTKDTWQIDIEKLNDLISSHTKLIIINTPQRPNGHLIENIDELAKFLQKYPNIIIISDEIFSHITYDDKCHKSISSIPEMKDRTIVIDTFSKTYAMTGFRIGWLVAPKPIIDKLSIFLQESITNVASFIQKAAYEAMIGPQQWVEDKRILLQKKRDRIVNELNSIPGFQCNKPHGTFYCFPNITKTGMNSQELTNYLMENAHVAVVAGTAFGSQGEGYIRLTFALPDDEIDEGIRRIKE